MYRDITNIFLNSIRSLRYYVNSVEEKMISTREEIDISDSNTLFARCLHTALQAKKNGVDLKKVEFSKELLLNKLTSEEKAFYEDGILEVASLLLSSLNQITNDLITEKIVDGKKTYDLVSIPKDIRQKYQRIEMEEKQVDILYSGSLMLLITYFENLVSGVMKKDFIKHPERMSLDDKSVSYRMLVNFGNITDIKEFLIDQEVTNRMYSSVTDWKKFFQKQVKLELLSWDENLKKIQEVIARRNVFVHNNGIVNSIYIELVGDDDNLCIGDYLKIDREYIDNAIDIFEYIGIALVIESWLKEYASDEDEIYNIMKLIYDEYLATERWEAARHFYEICLKSNKLCFADRMICQINRWQCFKWLGEYFKIEKEVNSVDVSACKSQYILGILALKEEYEEFFKCFDTQRDIDESELKEWPLFRKVRESDEFKRRFPEMICENNHHEIEQVN